MPSVVLSGFSGTGKSTVGPLVADRLGLPFVDTDDVVARRSGMDIASVWRCLGEATFRSIEAVVVQTLLDDGVNRVLALGGGALTDRALRHLAIDRGTVVTLTASPEVLLSRMRTLSSRPAQGGPSPLARVMSLLGQRAAAYAECHLRVETGALSPAAVAERVVAGVGRRGVLVPLGERTYRVEIVGEAPGILVETIRELDPSSVVVVTDRNVRTARASELDRLVRGLGVPVVQVCLEPGEPHKTLRSVQAIWDAAVDARVDRHAAVVGFGGGVVCDLAGFAASTLLRGVRSVLAPTTLLAMVDASVGGKTGFDLPAGKNLVGSFHQPSGVVADLAHLATLPERERVAGLAEVAKMALGFDVDLWGRLERDADRLRAGDPEALFPAVVRAVELKARVVRDDELERGDRRLLNLGHTVGHALEVLGGYQRLLHGEAVALGLVTELQATTRLGLSPAGLASRVRSGLERLGLPVSIGSEEVVAARPHMGTDKKRVGERLALPVLEDCGRARMCEISAREWQRSLAPGGE
jgi:shikimate kinase/3-dehydroquinate synthase